MNPVDQLAKMFGFTDLQKASCATCVRQTKAFGVNICRLGKPDPKGEKTCAWWMSR